MSTEQKKIKKSREEILAEIKLLSDQAEINASKQYDFLDEIKTEEVSGFDTSILNDTADPVKSHRLYYGALRLLKDNLPQDRENKKIRQFVYDEKNLFLNRGQNLDKNGKRGSDGRMTYISTFLEPVFNAVIEWIKEGGSAADMHYKFYEMNKKMGYHKDESSTE